MSTFRFPIILPLLAVSLASHVFADELSNRHSSRRHAQNRSRTQSRDSFANNDQHERVARDQWSPERRGPNVKHSGGNSLKNIHAVDLVDHTVPLETHSLPAPITDGDVITQMHPTEPLDGQIMSHGTPLESFPIHTEHGAACDALPGGICGCGELACDGGCDSICGADCTTCGELISNDNWRRSITLTLPQDGWASFEYLAWWQDGLEIPALVTTSEGAGVAATEAGVLGLPATRILFGGNEELEDVFNGGRLRFGVWLNRLHTWGIGAELFRLGSETAGFSQTSDGTPILARPFFNTTTGLEDSELVAFPGVLTGNVTATVSSRLSGAAIHFRNLRGCDTGCTAGVVCDSGKYCSRTELLLGYRFLQLDDSVRVTEDLEVPAPGAGAFDIEDNFNTRNQFNGFDIGWAYRRVRGFWTFDTQLRLGIGNTRQTVRIDGSTVITDPNATPASQTFPGGLLTQTSNIGEFQQDEFTIVPEFQANIGYQLTDNWRATFGYTFIYWSNVARAGNQIDTDVNTNLLPPPLVPLVGPQRPAFDFDTTDFWAQGINVGLEYRW